MTQSLHHFYHVYADGAWYDPLVEHIDALTRFGLYDALNTLHFGIVGRSDAISDVKRIIAERIACFEVCAEVPTGWEQETLEPLWKFTQSNDGLVSYAHTKGASRSNPIDHPWRRSMEFFNFVHWQRPVEALTNGYLVAGCHWFYGGLDQNPVYGTGGMFGGTFWWTHCHLLRQNAAPGRASRYEAEHWIGQITEHTPLLPELICDMNPGAIETSNLHDRW